MTKPICSYPVATHATGGHRIECGARVGGPIRITLHPNLEEDLSYDLCGELIHIPRGYHDRMQARVKFASVPQGITLEADVEYDIVYMVNEGTVSFH